MAEVESFKEKHIGGLPKHTLTTNTCEPSSETSIFSKCLKLLGENLLLSTIVNGRVI